MLMLTVIPRRWISLDPISPIICPKTWRVCIRPIHLSIRRLWLWLVGSDSMHLPMQYPKLTHPSCRIRMKQKPRLQPRKPKLIHLRTPRLKALSRQKLWKLRLTLLNQMSPKSFLLVKSSMLSEIMSPEKASSAMKKKLRWLSTSRMSLITTTNIIFPLTADMIRSVQRLSTNGRMSLTLRKEQLKHLKQLQVLLRYLTPMQDLRV